MDYKLYLVNAFIFNAQSEVLKHFLMILRVFPFTVDTIYSYIAQMFQIGVYKYVFIFWPINKIYMKDAESIKKKKLNSRMHSG